jgi:hypothetical protein
MGELQTIHTHKIHHGLDWSRLDLRGLITFHCTILFINGDMAYIETTKITKPKILNANLQSFEVMH